MRYYFDEFVLDTEHFEIYKNNQHLHAEPQVIELLALLVENSHRMVSKEEINEAVWHGRVVSEAALSSRIKTARGLLGDNGREQRFIRTVHKKGFRFVCEVEATTGVGNLPGDRIAKQESVDLPRQQQTIADNNITHSSKPAITVLPFSDLSGENQQDYFSDGITTDIISHLSKHRWLAVTARNTSFGYRGKTLDVRQIGKELGVNYVVEGSIQRAGNRVRVNVHLIDATSGLNRWTDTFDRELSDIFALQDEITEKIAARLEPEIGFAERNKVTTSRPANLQAWDCYHLGIYHFFQFTAEDNLEAQRLLDQCRQLDNSFGDAYVWWAYAVVLGMVYWGTAPTADLLDEALVACNRALSLDRQNAVFYALRGRVKLARREYESAIRDNEKAISINPTLAAAHCGLADSLAYEGRYDEAISRFEKAVALSPNDPQLWAFLTYGALALIFKRDFEGALRWLDQASNITNCQYWTAAHRVVALAHLDRIDEAKLAVAGLLQENSEFSCTFAEEKLFYLKQSEQISLYLDGLRIAGLN
ncbi:MAG: winged helix-turn-helix domain-containing tetratricopeptide repeat protein [Pseudomonadales bacterium]